MADIHDVSWRQFEKFLYTIGCHLKRTKGDHRIYSKPGLGRPIVIPAVRTLPVFIILNNLRILNISKEKFLEIIENM
jgi:predicted RNA binding protein YcfA (HicA-like mRNA interferase family)